MNLKLRVGESTCDLTCSENYVIDYDNCECRPDGACEMDILCEDGTRP